MEIVCLDMEGTLTEEIWQQVAKDTGIEDFAKTTRDIPSYSDLMDARLVVMEQEGITLKDIQRSSSKVKLLEVLLLKMTFEYLLKLSLLVP